MNLPRDVMVFISGFTFKLRNRLYTKDGCVSSGPWKSKGRVVNTK